jgi:CTP synthase
MTLDRRIMQILDYPTHPFFIATQFHPELLSRPLRPHPLFLEFVRAAKRHQAA